MKIAIVGGTHGNEPIGIEVVKALNTNKPNVLNEYDAFIGNPKACELQKRFVDSDLNRAFGKNSKPTGYEKERAKDLENQVRGKYDLIIDLHTTTTNMGLTAILNNTNKLTQKVCSYLKFKNPEMKLIEEDVLDLESTHLNRLAPAGITIEFGPVANNVLSGNLVIKMYNMILEILKWDFKEDFNFSKSEVYETKEALHYPENGPWYIHPEIENSDFKPLSLGAPLFTNLSGEVIKFEKEGVYYPFFINEAAYQNSSIAMFLAKKRN